MNTSARFTRSQGRKANRRGLNRRDGANNFLKGSKNNVCTSTKRHLPQRELRTVAFYEKHAEKFCRITGRLNLNQLCASFLSELPSKGSILDAGCGSGRDTKMFLTKGYQVKAIDASPKMAQIATQYTGQKCEAMSFGEIDFVEKFDGIWACASLLHVSHEEMNDVLDRFALALKKGGVLFVSLKKGSGEKVTKDGRFFSYYGLEVFKKLLVSEGRFEVIKTWKTHSPDSSRKTQCWLNFLVRKAIGTK